MRGITAREITLRPKYSVLGKCHRPLPKKGTEMILIILCLGSAFRYQSDKWQSQGRRIGEPDRVEMRTYITMLMVKRLP